MFMKNRLRMSQSTLRSLLNAIPQVVKSLESKVQMIEKTANKTVLTDPVRTRLVNKYSTWYLVPGTRRYLVACTGTKLVLFGTNLVPITGFYASLSHSIIISYIQPVSKQGLPIERAHLRSYGGVLLLGPDTNNLSFYSASAQ